LLWRVKTRVLLARYAAHLAVGQRARAYLLANGVSPAQIYGSPHAVDNVFFAATAAPYLPDAARHDARRACGFSPDDFIVLFVGKVSARKRLIDAVDAVGRLGSPYALLVAGDG